MTADQFTALLAERVMGWRVRPDRFMTGGRSWISRWRFQPLKRLEDAQRLLEQAAPQKYTLDAVENGGFRARVRIAGVAGEATAPSQAQAITLAVARAIGLEVPEGLLEEKPR